MTNVTNSLVKKDEAPKSLLGYLTSESIKSKITSMISGKDGEKFISSIVSAVNITPALQKCTHDSILAAALTGHALKLSPSPQLGQFYMVPYGNQAQFQIGYKGLIQLAIRSGQYKVLNDFVVKEGEFQSYDHQKSILVLNKIYDYSERKNKPTIGYGATLELVNGFSKTLYMDRAEMEHHAATFSAAYKSDLQYKTAKSFWSKDFDKQGRKTMLRLLINTWGIMSIEIQNALESNLEIEEPLNVSDQGQETQSQVQEAFFSNVSNEETAPSAS